MGRVQHEHPFGSLKVFLQLGRIGITDGLYRVNFRFGWGPTQGQGEKGGEEDVNDLRPVHNKTGPGSSTQEAKVN